MAKITPDEVKHVAQLANLPVTDSEVETFTGQLEGVLEYMDQLDELDTSDTAPTHQTLDGTTNIFRQDIVAPSLSQEEALSGSRHTHNGYFVVDNVFGDKKTTTDEVHIDHSPLDPYNAKITDIGKGNLAHKDLFVTKGIQTTAGSKILYGYIPQYSGTVVERLAKAGWMANGKYNEDAWGHGSSGENSAFGPTQNPWDVTRVPGGSSSGSAVAVAAGLAEVATATDTCGSVRMPAGYTNVSGIKPTYGQVSRYGVIAFASSLDCPGLFARDVVTLRNAFGQIAGIDQLDATSQSSARAYKSMEIKSIGLPKEFFDAGLDPQVARLVHAAADLLAQNGYKLVEVELPHTKYGVAAYYILAPVETASNLGRYDGVRYGHSRANFGPEAKRRIMLGTYASSAGYSAKYYDKAARVRSLIVQDMTSALSKVDALLGPVSPIPPFKIGSKVDDPLAMYLMDVYTAPASMAGLPSLSIPSGFTDDKLPVGLQLIGPRWSEEALFDVGEKYQKLTDWHTRKPPTT